MKVIFDQNTTLRDRVNHKLNLAAAGHVVSFDPLEARLAGCFVEDAVSLEEIQDGVEEVE